MKLFRRKAKTESPQLPAHDEVIVGGSNFDFAKLKDGQAVEHVAVTYGRSKFGYQYEVRFRGDRIGWLSETNTKEYRPVVGDGGAVRARVRKAGGGTKSLFVLLPCSNAHSKHPHAHNGGAQPSVGEIDDLPEDCRTPFDS